MLLLHREEVVPGGQLIAALWGEAPPGTAQTALEGLVVEYPFRERLRSQLMLALYRSGRQADALHVFQSGRKALVDELGIDPGPALQQLERLILNQDSSLEVEARTPPVPRLQPP